MGDEVNIKAVRVRLAAATPGPWHTVDVRCRDARPNEVGVCALTDPRSFQKPDGTWHGCFVARGMDGPTRDANATLIAEAPTYLAALCTEVEQLREIIAGRTTAPTDAEIEAHAKTGGRWLVAGDVWSRVERLMKPTDGCVQWCQPHRIDLHHGMTREWRWWPLDASGAPTQWPEVAL